MNHVAADCIKKVLNSTGLYDCTKPNISAELGAYEVGFREISKLMEDCLSNAFILTADEHSLNIREMIFRKYISDISVDEKRAFLMERNRISECFTEDFNGKLVAAGIIGNVVENYQDGIYININELKGITQEGAIEEAKNILPAHLPIYTDFIGNCWGNIDDKDISFGDFDDLDRTWQTIETQ